MYGAKGGEVYVLGNAAGRSLINSASGPRVIINGTCLDFLAESFMAGDPYKWGGFVILKGIEFDNDDCVERLGNSIPWFKPFLSGFLRRSICKRLIKSSYRIS